MSFKTYIIQTKNISKYLYEKLLITRILLMRFQLKVVVCRLQGVSYDISLNSS
jgi:hypothetical protein